MNETKRKLSWSEQRRRSLKALPRLHIARVHVESSKKYKGRSLVYILGAGFKPWMVPPQVRVDGALLENLCFLKDGTLIRGELPKSARGDEVYIDLGYASVSWRRSP